MGFLKIYGRALNWDESTNYFQLLRDNTVQNVISYLETEPNSSPKFGYEVKHCLMLGRIRQDSL